MSGFPKKERGPGEWDEEGEEGEGEKGAAEIRLMATETGAVEWW